MATTAFVIDRFTGLNVADDPATVGPTGATDILNADIDISGRVRTRAGYSLVKAITTTTTEGLAAFETTSGTTQFVVGYTNSGTKKYEAYASTGGAAVSSATPTSTVVNAVRWGDPSNEYLYIANGADTVWRWTGAAFSQPAGMPSPAHLSVSPLSNRLVAANGTSSSDHSRVWFSGPGTPETWSLGAGGWWVDLAPGDGSGITGLASWSDQVFAFKKNRFFVFTNEYPDQDGEPVFNYHPVDGYGALVPPVSGDEGVYFFDGRRIWATTGGTPTRISRVIEPLLQGTATAGGLSGVDQTLLASVRLFYSLGRLFVKIPMSSTTYYTLVFDPKIDAWTIYFTATPMEWVTTVRPASTDQKYTYFFGAVTASVNKFDPSLTQDVGSAVFWNWVSGLTDMGEPGRVKVTLESRAWGVGSVSLGVATDYGATDSPTALTLGTSPTVADAWQQVDREGTLWKTSVSGGSWGGIDRIAHYVSFTKPSGVQ